MIEQRPKRERHHSPWSLASLFSLWVSVRLMPENACGDVSGLTLSDDVEMTTYMLDQAFLLLLNFDYLERTVDIGKASL